MEISDNLQAKLEEELEVLKRRVAELEQTEAALRESEERYRYMFEKNQAVKLVIDPETGVIVEANAAACEFYGYQPYEITKLNISDINVLSEQELAEEMRRAATERRTYFVFKHRLASGEIRDVEVHSGPIMQKGRRLLYSIIHDITDRIKAEQERNALIREQAARVEAEASRKRITSILESITDAFFAVDNDWNFTYVNSQAEKLLQRNRGELLGQNLWKVFPEANDSNFSVQYRKAVLEQVSVTFEDYYEPLSIWVEVRAYPTPDGLSVYFHDIANRKLIEHQLRESERRYRELADAMPLIVWTATPDGLVNYFNRRWYEYTGQSPEESQGWGWEPVLHPDDRPICVERWTEAVRTGQNYEIEYRFRRASDGSYRWHLGRAFPVRNQEGEIEQWVGSSTDIDDQKRAEFSLRLLAEASDALVSSLEYESTLQSVARLALPALADYSIFDLLQEDQTLQRAAVAHFDPVREALVRDLFLNNPSLLNNNRNLTKVLRSGESLLIPDVQKSQIRALNLSKGNEQKLNELNPKSAMFIPLFARGRLLGVLTLVSAESGRRYGPQDLALAEELARRAALAVDNARLYKQLQDALDTQKELDYLKDLFVSVAGHELRTPLTSIRGYAQMLERHLLRQQAQPQSQNQQQEAFDKNFRFLESILYQADRMNGLVSQLLDFSRLQNSQFELSPKPDVDLMELTQNVVEQQSIAARDHSLVIDIINNRIVGEWDESRLEQVLNNLVSNAIKYSSPGTTVTVGLQVRKVEDPKPENPGSEEVVVWVRDEGQGIPYEDQTLIFNRFYRARNGQNRKVEGLGLGLYISHEIVTKHGGRMWLESEPGKGSTFYFSLPLLGNPKGE